MTGSLLRLLPALTLLAALGAPLPGCSPRAGVGKPAVSMKLERQKGTPGDAGVWIDEEFIGPLSFVAARGVRLPIGEHRITIQKEGYFPWDRLLVSDRKPIFLEVRLDPIPD